MKSFLLSILLLLSASIPWIYTVNSGVNLRKGPSNEKRVLTTVPQGEEIIVYEKTNEWWWQVEYKGKKGYIAATFIDRSYSKTALMLIKKNPKISLMIGISLVLFLLLSTRKKRKTKKNKIPKNKKK